MVEAAPYCAEITTPTGARRAGVMFTRAYLVTAAHCVKGIDVGADVSARLGDEPEPVSATLLEVRPRQDLALLSIAGKVAPSSAAVVTTCRANDFWWDPYRPLGSDGHLKGAVAVADVDYDTKGGGRVPALQLTQEFSLGDYSGYSGSPIAKGVPDGSEGIVGLLIEQLPNRADVNQATTALFAVRMSFVVGQFYELSNDRLMRDLIPQLGHGDMSSFAQLTLEQVREMSERSAAYTSRHADDDAALRKLHDLQLAFDRDLRWLTASEG